MSPIIYYILSSVLIIGVLVGIYLMSKVKLSRLGNILSAVCMASAIILTMVNLMISVEGKTPVLDPKNIGQIIIYISLGIAFIIGIVITKKVKMIEMPQMVALLNGIGGAASFIVGCLSLMGIAPATFDLISGEEILSTNAFSLLTSTLAIVVGAATLSGSLIAAGKLHRLIPQKPVVLKGHMTLTMGSLIISLLASLLATILGATGVITNTGWEMGILMAVILLSSLAFGVIFSIRVGGADMPITISLLNSLSGVAGAIAGLAMNDLLLVAIGGIVGASGLLLTQAMCKSMNRKLLDILTGKTSTHGTKATSAPKADEEVKESTPKKETTKVNQMDILRNAKKVIIVPGYGMAIAQAQYLVKALADMIRGFGAEVKYAIHPVAGRMPGHMNVLLCEADVDYEDLYEMDAINDEFRDADATIVIGANDVLNPAANTEVDTPIYGMPVLHVADCKNIFIFNYDKKPGYAGVNNPIYDRTEGLYMHLGNAAETLKAFMNETETSEETVVESTAETKSNEQAVLKKAKNVIIVPGYGMAIAQAQHLVKELADKLRGYGASVKFAIHPVAGRMPGHMNVLLCEADVDYEDLYEMDAINDEFKDADATIVIGANDVLNPAANTEVDTPIYGMPVLHVNDCKNIFIFNYDKSPGYAGVDNPIYHREEGVHLYLGNAADTLKEFIESLNNTTSDEVKVEEKHVEENIDAVNLLKEAKHVLIVPGYGMAIAQAQHLVKELADKLRGYGASVKFAIHPVAGRMPGHMNVLLCEADVDYEDLYEMDAINDEFKDADATIVVGANDVLNPAANTEVDTPIYGMPVLHVNDCKNIFIFNYDKSPGYAGVDNPIYTRKNGVYLYLGNAKDTLQDFISKLS